MQKIKITLQYDGTNFSGWQVQKKEATIQGLLENAVLKITGEQQRVTGAARTDAGVHAFEQVATFSTGSSLSPYQFLRAINAHLPDEISLINAAACDKDFHPRYDARDKTYSYLISRPGANSVFLKRYSWLLPYPLNCSLMRAAAQCLIGKKDLSSFRASGCSAKHPVRELLQIDITETDRIGFLGFDLDAPLIKITIRANAFLRHMARNIVGTLIDFGRGRTAPEKMQEILELKDRCAAGKTAPACGLFLEKINY